MPTTSNFRKKASVEEEGYIKAYTKAYEAVAVVEAAKEDDSYSTTQDYDCRARSRATSKAGV